MKPKIDDKRPVAESAIWDPEVVIVGAGFAGLGMAVHLKRAGLKNFRVIERHGGPGGVWMLNDFPGAEVDTESEAYRLSFATYPWSRSHAKRDELLKYFDEIVNKNDLQSYITYNAEVRSVTWQDDSSSWIVTLDSGAEIAADVVITAVGLFSKPNMPDWPGLSEFRGVARHSSRWDRTIDVTGKRVAVVGTGSTCASIVPAIAEQVDKLYVYQRDPGWVLPKRILEFDTATSLRRARPLRARWNRMRSLRHMQLLFSSGKAARAGTRPARRLQRRVEAYLAEAMADRPDLEAILRPNHPVLGKRVVLSSDYYPALKRPNVEVVPHPVVAATPDGIVDESGAERKVDVIAIATGFKAAEFLPDISVIGPGGVELHEVWRGDPAAFLGICVPQFPNFFMIYGPNTSGSSGQLFVEESQIRFICRCVNEIRRHRCAILVRRWAFDRYQGWLYRELDKSVLGSTHNYFKGAHRIVTNFPRGFMLYAMLARLSRRVALQRVPLTDLAMESGAHPLHALEHNP